MSLLGGLIGAGTGFLTGGPAGAVVGGLSGLSGTGSKLQKQASKYQGQAAGIAQGQTGLFNNATQAQNDLLNFYQNYATGGGPVYQNGAANGQRQLGASNAQLGIYGSPADAIRNTAAQEDINHFANANARNLQNTLGMRGVASATRDAIQGQNNLAALQDYGNFRRQLALNAGPEEAARYAQLAQVGIQPGLQAGEQAAQTYGGLGGSYLGQAQNYNQGIGQTIGNLGYLNALKQFANPNGRGVSNAGVGGETLPAAPDSIPGQYTTDPNGNIIPAFAHGGHIQAGQEALVGEAGSPETFVPDRQPPAKGQKQDAGSLLAGLIDWMKQYVPAPQNQMSMIPGRAGGGPVSAGQPYQVGEGGPELFVPMQDGQIIPRGSYPYVNPDWLLHYSIQSGQNQLPSPNGAAGSLIPGYQPGGGSPSSPNGTAGSLTPHPLYSTLGQLAALQAMKG